ncbi:MAG: NAD-dependent epimerase/dehydratase family protein [Candidatus Methanoperedens sp.]|nr:NAD-dependent epimerase/dehydratase family protein [Candidatus Methanoperedens sp.]
MAVLVTGGSGFIGSHVVDKLKESGFDVLVFDILKPHRDDITFIKGDITSRDQLNNAMQDIEYVYHIAGASDINKVEKQPVNAVDLNILSTAKVLDAARANDVARVLFASSYFVDSGKGHLYATTKKASEMICSDYNTLYGLPFTILRYGTAYGPRSRGEDVISLFVKRALSGEPLEIHGSGAQSRNFIYVEDLAKGNVAALSEVAKNRTYILEGCRAVTIRELAEIVTRIFDEDLDIRFGSKRPDDYSGDKASNISYKELRWEPEIDIEVGIRRYIKWYTENK